MTITAQQFVDVWLKQGGSEEDLGSYCKSAYSLVKKYSARLKTKKVRDIIKKYDISLLGFLDLLDYVNKANCEDIKHIWSLIDGGHDHQWSISTSHPDRVKDIKKGAYIEEQEEVGLTVQGDGKIYKRSLDRDVGKLLQS